MVASHSEENSLLYCLQSVWGLNIEVKGVRKRLIVLFSGVSELFVVTKIFNFYNDIKINIMNKIIEFEKKKKKKGSANIKFLCPKIYWPPLPCQAN